MNFLGAGVNKRALQTLLEVAAAEADTRSVTLSVASLEIYNEVLLACNLSQQSYAACMGCMCNVGGNHKVASLPVYCLPQRFNKEVLQRLQSLRDLLAGKDAPALDVSGLGPGPGKLVTRSAFYALLCMASHTRDQLTR